MNPKGWAGACQGDTQGTSVMRWGHQGWATRRACVWRVRSKRAATISRALVIESLTGPAGRWGCAGKGKGGEQWKRAVQGPCRPGIFSVAEPLWGPVRGSVLSAEPVNRAMWGVAAGGEMQRTKSGGVWVAAA